VKSGKPEGNSPGKNSQNGGCNGVQWDSKLKNVQKAQNSNSKTRWRRLAQNQKGIIPGQEFGKNTKRRRWD